MNTQYGSRTPWHGPQVKPETLYPPTAIVWDDGVMRFRVQKLDGVLNNVPIYRFVSGRTYEQREDAVRDAAFLAQEVPTIQTPCPPQP